MEGYSGSSPDLPRAKHGRRRHRCVSYDANDTLEELCIRGNHCKGAAVHELDDIKVDIKLDVLDFRNELDDRHGSTSTPFIPRTLSCTNIMSCDSCFSESAVASSFASSCRVRSRIDKSCDRADKSYTSGYATEGDTSIDDMDRLPLPRLCLYSEFMSMEDDPADETDSAFCSFLSPGVDTSNDASLCVASPRHSVTESCPVCRRELLVSTGVCQYCSACTTDTSFSAKLRQCLLTDPAWLIGRKMGDDEVDIISELSDRSLHSPIAIILSNLSDEDLCRLCCVSVHWKSVCKSDTKAHQRRKLFIKSHRVLSQDKENMGWKRWSPGRSVTCAKEPLAKVQCLAETTDCVALVSPPSLSRSDKFIQEARQLRTDESLCSCPKCQCPARVHSVQERAWCTRETCKFDFCIMCHNAFHGARDCSQVTPGVRRPKTDSNMCSRRSKRNLKRL